MEGVNFESKNLFTDAVKYSGILTDGEFGENGVIILKPGGSFSFTIPERNMQSDSRYLKSIVKFLGTDATASNYNTPIFNRISVGYSSTGIRDENYIIVNRDSELVEKDSETDGETTVYTNECVVTNKGWYILDLTCSYVNNSEEDFIIKGIELYLSADASVYQIAKIVKEEVISADIIHATANFSDTMFTQFLRTNVFSMDAIQNVGGGTVRYLVAEEWNMGFYTAKLSSTETEQFAITYKVGNETKTIPFWYALIGDAEDAYKYLTTIDPRTKYPDISPEDRDKFRFMVWKQEETAKKLSIEFAQTSDGAGNKTDTPVITLGAGSGGNSLSGKMLIYKDVTGGYMKYTTRGGEDVGIILDDNGGTLKGFVNDVEYADIFTDGVKYKFKGDPLVELLDVYDDSGAFVGFETGDGVVIPIRSHSGSIKG